MNILVGVDSGRHYRSALSVLARLKPWGALITLLHVDEGASFPVALPHTPTFSGTGRVVLDAAGGRLLQQAAQEAASMGLSTTSLYEAGNVVDQLLLQAGQLPANLIAIGSRNRGALATAVLGSTEHALAIHSTSSFLVAHGNVAVTGPVRALFATDQSDFASEAFDRFLNWIPQGLTEVIVFTAIEPERASDEGHMIATARRCAEIGGHLQRFGIRSSIRIRIGDPAREIDAAMKELGSDLLILCARGHGFVERVALGSVGTSLTSSASYPVLVLRPFS